MKKPIQILFVALFLASGCKKIELKNEISTAEVKKANDFFEKSFNEGVDRSPIYQSYLGIKKDYDKWDDFSPESEERELEIAKKELKWLKDSIDYNLLDENTKLSYRLFEYNAKLKIEGFEWRFHSYPVNQMFGWHSELPSFLINIHQIADSSDAVAYVSRIKASDKFISQLIENLKLRESKGIVAPKFVYPMVIDDCKNLLRDKPFEPTSAIRSTLSEDFNSKISILTLKSESKKNLQLSLDDALVSNLKPAYTKLINYLTELQERATTDDGVWKLPKGDKYYAFALKSQTTTNLSPEEIFDLGTKEVARIQDKMREIMKITGFKNDSLQAFFRFMKTDKQFYLPNDSTGKKKYLLQATAIIDTMRSKLDELFITKPKAPMIVKAVEPFREKSAGSAFYQDPAPDGSRPGIYYVNLYDMNAMPTYEMEALAYHEGIPGHHMQLAIAQELENTPKFRKYNYSYTAYVEGWALYTELIPKEIGYYQDPYSDFGRLSMELWRACRLVVDVGIHHKKWTREQAIKYLQENTPSSDRECVKSIERYIVMPGQATAYKVGMLKILSLREKARKSLGNRFDIRAFHDEVLRSGALPLDVLEQNINKYIEVNKK